MKREESCIDANKNDILYVLSYFRKENNTKDAISIM
jgi:hypothetical protein